MGTIISLRDEAHDEAQKLLAWYANGTLTESETARVEVHLAHCEECRADLAAERAIGGGIAGQSLDVEHGWADMQRRIAAASAPRRPAWYARRVPVGWVLGMQAAAAALIVVVFLPGRTPSTPSRLYHALGTAPVAATGNLVVMFSASTREAELRAAFASAGARIVDGPTVAGAYVLHVPGATRDAALARLRRDSHVTLAEPIDPGDEP